MKIGTWNVNGIRARLAQVQEWIVAERPDVVCLQEIKATPDQIPTVLCEMEGYWCYWHGGKGYSGVGLHVSRDLLPDRPQFAHPAFDYENRIVTVDLPGVTVASVYVPNGGKDFPAKMQFFPISVEPEIPLCEAITVFSPMTTLCAICTRLSIFTPFSIIVDPMVARSMVVLAPTLTLSFRITFPN